MCAETEDRDCLQTPKQNVKFQKMMFLKRLIFKMMNLSNFTSIVPVTSRRTIATPSRRRRIIYKTARRARRYALKVGVHKVQDNIAYERASIAIQRCFR